MQLDQPKNTPYLSQYKSLITLVCLIFTILFSIFSLSGTAHAGLISFVGSVFSSGQASAKVLPSASFATSQNLDILEAANNQDPNPNKVVETIPVYSGETLYADLAAASATSTDYNTQISTYVVRSGDNISSVAKMFNVSVNTILWANDLNGRSILKVGQTLVILPISGINYTVVKGDTFTKIAKKYNADVTDILNYNDLNLNSPLVTGMNILIPSAELSAPPVTPIRGKITKAPKEPLLDDVRNWPKFDGYYSCPVAGRLTQALHGHNAIDLAAPSGTALHASAAGTVIISKSNGAWNGGYGNFVVISHPNDTQTLYGHMLRSIVKSGDSVTRGQVIGYLGSTGMSTGPHVHFELRGAQNPFANASCE